MMRRSLLLAVSLVGLSALASPVAAQCTVVGLTGATCVQNRNITATVLRTVRVTITPTVTTLASPNDTDFNNGFSVSAGPTVQVRANRNWQVTVRSTAATWTGTAGARTNKPRADLLRGTSIAGPWTPISGTAAVFATGGPTDATVAPLFYRVNWFFALDRPGVYTISIQYTISST
jgi:hypothetical protein